MTHDGGMQRGLLRTRLVNDEQYQLLPEIQQRVLLQIAWWHTNTRGVFTISDEVATSLPGDRGDLERTLRYAIELRLIAPHETPATWRFVRHLCPYFDQRARRRRTMRHCRRRHKGSRR